MVLSCLLYLSSLKEGPNTVSCAFDSLKDTHGSQGVRGQQEIEEELSKKTCSQLESGFIQPCGQGA